MRRGYDFHTEEPADDDEYEEIVYDIESDVVECFYALFLSLLDASSSTRGHGKLLR